VDKIASALLSEAAGIALALWYIPDADGLAFGAKAASLAIDGLVALVNAFELNL
jgi:hypothetical protein